MKIQKRIPICNNNPSSAPHINGRCFVLCWRCTGAAVGALITSCIVLALNYSLFFSPPVFVLGIPACVDYFLTRGKIIQPNNLRRFLSGILLGVMFAMLIITALQNIK